MVDQQRRTVLGNVGPNGLQQLLRGTDVAADGTDIGLDDAKGDVHGSTSFWRLSEAYSCILFAAVD
jgi:hypothetical protein